MNPEQLRAWLLANPVGAQTAAVKREALVHDYLRALRDRRPSNLPPEMEARMLLHPQQEHQLAPVVPGQPVVDNPTRYEDAFRTARAGETYRNGNGGGALVPRQETSVGHHRTSGDDYRAYLEALQQSNTPAFQNVQQERRNIIEQTYRNAVQQQPYYQFLQRMRSRT